jgi:hypothetical protein
MEFWNLLVGLQGKVLKTLGQGKPFTVINVSQGYIYIVPHKNNKGRTIDIKEIEGAYRRLKTMGQITRVEIEAQFSPRSPAYVAAILATLPGVRSHGKPIITLEM